MIATNWDRKGAMTDALLVDLVKLCLNFFTVISLK